MILFDFGDPEKIDLLTFMQKNYKFNVSLEYLAFLSGIDHKNALNNVFPEVRKNNISLVMGINLNAGFLSGSNRHNYGGGVIPPEYLKKREELRAVAKAHHVDLRTAALQFASFPDVAAAIIPGVKGPNQIREDYESMQLFFSWRYLAFERIFKHFY